MNPVSDLFFNTLCVIERLHTAVVSFGARAVTLTLLLTLSLITTSRAQESHHVWEMVEIVLEAENEYENPYADVMAWVELEGPGFDKRIYGFWDGDNIFRVRVVATAPGEWNWTSGSNQTGDAGLNGQSGSFTAEEWSDEEMEENPNRRGFVRATPNGRALQYADGTPFFMIGDTWLAGATWRLPYRGVESPENYMPGPGIGFEDAVAYRARQGFNSVSMISSFPNWESDIYPSTYADSNGVFLRNAWEKFEYDVQGGPGVDASGGFDSYWGSLTSKNMRDDYGNAPFAMSEEHSGVSNFDRLNPEYFQTLDKKMFHLAEEGWVPMLETVRRDVTPSWKAYFDFNESYSRYVQYIISRYGALNILFSGIHLDWIPDDFSLSADEFNEVLTYHLDKYGPLPFGQPHSVLINNSTYRQFGHGEESPWLTMHSVGNNPRNHGVYEFLEEIFELDPPYPAINFEPYYTGWDHSLNRPGDERPPANSPRDNYFARAQMYGSVLSGGLAGHVHGTASYDVTTTGEPDGARPHIWDALAYESANYMRHLESFILSEGGRYQQLLTSSGQIHPRKTEESLENGLDGWSFMMRTADGNFALLYFENGSARPVLSGFDPGEFYNFEWFNPRTGEWLDTEVVDADSNGDLVSPVFPGGEELSSTDWGAKITATN